MLEDRPEDIVVLDGRAFILHYRTDAVRALGVAIGVAPRPLLRRPAAGDEPRQSARVVLLIVAPPRHAPRLLQVLKAFARLLDDADALRTIHESTSPEQLVASPVFQQALPDQLSVRDIMTEQPRTTTADAALIDAARQLLRARLGALPVVDESLQLVGMLSERELLRDLATSMPLGGGKPSRAGPASGGAAPRTVRDVMTRQVICVGPDQPLAEVAALMTNRDVDRVPVVDEGRLVGFLTRGDIVRKLIGP